MPVIKIDYDSNKFDSGTVQKLSEELQKAAAAGSELDLKDVSVFASANQIAINAAPMEVYVQVGSASIPDGDVQKMLDVIAEHMAAFKKDHNITTPINLSVVQMTWKFKLGV